MLRRPSHKQSVSFLPYGAQLAATLHELAGRLSLVISAERHPLTLVQALKVCFALVHCKYIVDNYLLE